MLWWLFVLALFYASARWTAVGTVIRVIFFAAGVLAALAIGDQGAIDRADWELFRVTGVAHLISSKRHSCKPPET